MWVLLSEMKIFEDNEGKGMPCDQYKMSIEARPLQVLYTKYSPCDVNSQYPCVRPLGRVRQERRPSSEQPRSQPDGGAGENLMCNGNKDMKLNRKLDSEKCTAKKFRSEQNIPALDYRERENTGFPLLNVSRSQAFESKFKIAAARGNSHELTPLKRQKTFDISKRVVHLPLFRIDLTTYSSDFEVSRTVAKTRESLRKLMELHTSKMKSNSVTTANIRNYEFNAPVTLGFHTNRSTDLNSNPSLSKPFFAKPALRSSRGQRERDQKLKTQTIFRQNTKLGAVDNLDTRASTQCSLHTETPCLSSRPPIPKLGFQTPGIDDEPDDSMLSVAIRPDTSLTLGSTMNHLEGVLKSPGPDELRELNEVLRNGENQSAWPGADEAQRLVGLRSHSRNRRSRTSFSRSGTVLHDLIETPDDTVNHNFHYYHSGHGPKPVLRYTSKSSSAYKLDPIIVPSHTCTECALCNIYQREVETSCPPNTPNTSLFMLESESPSSIRPPFVRGTKLVSKPEIMNISRVHTDSHYMDEGNENVLSYTNGS